MAGMKELDRWLMQRVLKGEKGAGEIRDLVKAKARADIYRGVAAAQPPGANLNHRTDFPGHANQHMMETADDDFVDAFDRLSDHHGTHPMDLIDDQGTLGTALRRWKDMKR